MSVGRSDRELGSSISSLSIREGPRDSPGRQLSPRDPHNGFHFTTAAPQRTRLLSSDLKPSSMPDMSHPSHPLKAQTEELPGIQ